MVRVQHVMREDGQVAFQANGAVEPETSELGKSRKYRQVGGDGKS